MSFSASPAGFPRAGSVFKITDAFGNSYGNIAHLTFQGLSGTKHLQNTALGGGTSDVTMFGAPIFTSTVTLTSAQIAASSGVPVTVVPAMGPSSAVVVVNSWYTNLPGNSGWVSGVGGLYYTSSGVAAADLGDKDVFRSLSGALALSGPVANVSGLLTNYANAPLVYQASTPYINGNGTGIINVAWIPITV